MFRLSSSLVRKAAASMRTYSFPSVANPMVAALRSFSTGYQSYIVP